MISYKSRLPKLLCNAKRGDLVRTPGGAIGVFVGRTKVGSDWVAYAVAQYEPMCRAFDKRK